MSKCLTIAEGSSITDFREAKINLEPDSIEDVVFACCVLHNFLRRNSPDKYTPQGSLDVEDEDHVVQEGLRAGDTNIAAMRPCATKNTTDQAKETRVLQHYWSCLMAE